MTTELGDLYKQSDAFLLSYFDLGRISKLNDFATLSALSKIYNIYTQGMPPLVRFGLVDEYEMGMKNRIHASINAGISYGSTITGVRFLKARDEEMMKMFLEQKLRSIRDYLVKLTRTEAPKPPMGGFEPTLTKENFKPQPVTPVSTPAMGGLTALGLKPPAPVPVSVPAPVLEPVSVPAQVPVLAATTLAPFVNKINVTVAKGIPRKKFLGISYRNSVAAKQIREDLQKNIDALQSQMREKVDILTGKNVNLSMTALSKARQFAKNLGYPLLEGLKPGEIAEGAILTRMGGARRTVKRRAGARTTRSHSKRPRSRKPSSGGRAGTRRRR